MWNKRALGNGSAFLISVAVCASANAATLTVGQPNNSCSNAQYNTIAAAVNAAASGDVLEICPAVYPEQLVITKPLTLKGISTQVGGLGINRVLLQPNLQSVQGLTSEAVITVMNTQGVTIENLTIDASKNTVSGCAQTLADVNFLNASGTVANNAIYGAQLADPKSCAAAVLPLGNGYGVYVNSTQSGPFLVTVSNNSIHDFTSNGVLVTGAGVTAEIDGNSISGLGPSIGVLQFGVFILNGAVGHVRSNMITEGLCGALSISDCIGVRSEGVTLRSVGDGTVVDSNIISNAQSGIFINGANHATVTNNQIRNIQALDGIDVILTSGTFTQSLIEGNTISNVGPIDQNASDDEAGCGINEESIPGISGNTISNNTVSDAYCGVASVAADTVISGKYFNTLYTELNSDLYPDSFPPPLEPAPSTMTTAVASPKNVTVATRQFQLDGTKSTSADGRPLTYLWTLPKGSLPAAIVQGTTATPTVQFGLARGLYMFQLTVTDSTGTTSTDLATVNFIGN